MTIKLHNKTSSTVLEGLEYESDRAISEFQFEATPFNEALLTRLDEIGQLITRKQSLYTLLLVSNFQLAPFEARDITLGLVENLGGIDEERLMMLENACMLTRDCFDKIRGDFLLKSMGVLTFKANQRHSGWPVYRLISDKAFTNAIVAATIQLEYGDKLDLPDSTHKGWKSPFTMQLTFLSRLESGDKHTTNILYDYGATKQQVLDTIVSPLFKAGFISRTGYRIRLRKSDLLALANNSILKHYILDLIGEEEEKDFSYRQIWTSLMNSYSSDPRFKSDIETKRGNISKYLEYLRLNNLIEVYERQQTIGEDDMGRFGRSQEFRITGEGLNYLLRVKHFMEDPKSALGDPSNYYIFENNRLLPFSQLDTRYQNLILHLLSQIMR
ncbi:MAG: hypothetical protein UT34_C0002G0301 [candidate division WS6 bacterium GW2011_GWF2_39_15]|uniref:Uncharacterized protein n=1 Tax=candidate division WS6 bacterium GW2011_GWF2_39_15 TaxID=1619100 RepID=A0A0G0MNZ9_9BACT|nr:MAG: hypothetical protein UT34_C0002G0301 [candidate division WS6 bacterium GW2011_GWF2_39_15]